MSLREAHTEDEIYAELYAMLVKRGEASAMTPDTSQAAIYSSLFTAARTANQTDRAAAAMMAEEVKRRASEVIGSRDVGAALFVELLQEQPGDDESVRGCFVLTDAELHRLWCEARAAGDVVKHPLAPLVRWWVERPLAERHLLVTSARGLHLARTPGTLALTNALLEVVPVDGEPFASAQPGQAMTRYQVLEPQGKLFPAPRSLDKQSTAGALVEALADFALTGDERSPLRSDISRLGHLAYALTGTARLTEAEGAILVGRADTPANRLRFWRAHRAARFLSIRTGKYGARLDLVNAEGQPGDVATLGPPTWWLSGTGPMAHRLTGALFRPATMWGALDRTVAGLEGGLAWGPFAGRGKDGQIPDALRPLRKGGPGPAVLVPWWQVLRLSGEPVSETDSQSPRARMRYTRRVSSLCTAGYFVPAGGDTAPAGDTIEVVQQVRGSRSRPACLIVRATARWCAAVSRGSTRERLSAAWILEH